MKVELTRVCFKTYVQVIPVDLLTRTLRSGPGATLELDYDLREVRYEYKGAVAYYPLDAVSRYDKAEQDEQHVCVHDEPGPTGSALVAEDDSGRKSKKRQGRGITRRRRNA